MPYAATIFLSSFLLFLVQPLIARQILPWFGGTAAVWTTCMLFFQTLLLGGYASAQPPNAKRQPRAGAGVPSLPAVLPDAAAGRLRLRARHQREAAAALAGAAAFGAARCRTGDA